MSAIKRGKVNFWNGYTSTYSSVNIHTQTNTIIIIITDIISLAIWWQYFYDRSNQQQFLMECSRIKRNLTIIYLKSLTLSLHIILFMKICPSIHAIRMNIWQIWNFNSISMENSMVVDMSIVLSMYELFDRLWTLNILLWFYSKWGATF